MPRRASDESAVSSRDALLRVPSRTFVLGDAISPAVTVELGRVVPLTGREPSVLWVHGEDGALRRFERRAADDDSIRSLTPVGTTGSTRLYRVEWVSSPSPLSAAFDESEVVVRRVESRETEWRLRLLSLEPGGLAVFGQECSDREIPYTIDRISTTCAPDEAVTTGLTAAQTEALQVASERGYFEVPREATLDDLGAELGISRQAVSFRLRRGIGRLVETAVPAADWDLEE